LILDYNIVNTKRRVIHVDIETARERLANFLYSNEFIKTDVCVLPQGTPPLRQLRYIMISLAKLIHIMTETGIDHLDQVYSFHFRLRGIKNGLIRIYLL
jgi:hypothetical protein